MQCVQKVDWLMRARVHKIMTPERNDLVPSCFLINLESTDPPKIAVNAACQWLIKTIKFSFFVY